MLENLWNKIKDYKKTLYVSVGVGSIIIGFSALGYLVKKKILQIDNTFNF